MGFFSKLFTGKESDPIVARRGVVAIRRAEIAALIKRPTDPNFAIERMTEACSRCGGPLAEAFITTGGELGDESVWREHPVAVDGWACAPCGVFRYPRKIDPARIHAMTEEGAAKGRAGDYAGAELIFARIVWNWPGYFLGHANYAEAIRVRRNAEAANDPAIARTLSRQMNEQLEAAIAAYAAHPVPSLLPAVAHAYATIARDAVRVRATERALRTVEEGLALDGLAEADRAELETIRTFVVEGRQRFEDAHEVLGPYLRLQGRPNKSVETGDERKRIVAAVNSLKELVADAPTYWQAAWLLGKGEEALGNVDDALATLRAAHAKHPAAEPIAKDLSLLLLGRDEIDEANAVNRTICAAHPSAANLCNLAVTAILAGDLHAASAAVEKSMRLDPNDPITNAVTARIAKYRGGAKLPRTMRELERG